MEDPTIKFHTTVGSNVFELEGPSSVVMAAYDKWLAVVKDLKGTQTQDEPRSEPTRTGGIVVTDVQVARLYVTDQDRKVVSLKHLPSDSPTRASEAAMLLLFGFKKMLGIDDVLVTRLIAGLRTSGIHVNRLDGIMEQNQAWVRKGGSRIGGRYTLNNQGLIQAEALVKKFLES